MAPPCPPRPVDMRRMASFAHKKGPITFVFKTRCRRAARTAVAAPIPRLPPVMIATSALQIRLPCARCMLERVIGRVSPATASIFFHAIFIFSTRRFAPETNRIPRSHNSTGLLFCYCDAGGSRIQRENAVIRQVHTDIILRGNARRRDSRGANLSPACTLVCSY